MTEKQKIRLAIKAIIGYAMEHYGWGAKFHPDQLEKYNALMEIAERLSKNGNTTQEWG